MRNIKKKGKVKRQLNALERIKAAIQKIINKTYNFKETKVFRKTGKVPAEKEVLARLNNQKEILEKRIK